MIASASKKDLLLVTESQEEEVKLSVASCLPFLVATPSEKQQRAADLVAACQETAVISQQEEVWRIESCGPQAPSTRAKQELGLADLQRFIDCLLRPDKIAGPVKVSSSWPQAILCSSMLCQRQRKLSCSKAKNCQCVLDAASVRVCQQRGNFRSNVVSQRATKTI